MEYWVYESLKRERERERLNVGVILDENWGDIYRVEFVVFFSEFFDIYLNLFD
jgi:hypothetical protein